MFLISLVETGSVEAGVLGTRDSSWKDEDSMCRCVGELLLVSQISLVTGTVTKSGARKYGFNIPQGYIPS